MHDFNSDDREAAKKNDNMNIRKKHQITQDLRFRMPIFANECSLLPLSGAVDPTSGMPSVQDRVTLVVHHLEL